MIGVVVFLAKSGLFHYFMQEDHTFLIYLCPNVYIFSQMCIFSTNLIKFIGLKGSRPTRPRASVTETVTDLVPTLQCYALCLSHFRNGGPMYVEF